MHQMQAWDRIFSGIEMRLVHAPSVASLSQYCGHGATCMPGFAAHFLSSICKSVDYAEAAPGTPRTALSRSDQLGSRGRGQPAGAPGSALEVTVEAKTYSACMDVMQSDHKPVCALLNIVLPSLAPPQARRCGLLC